jgi:hypothetical protein
MRLFFEILLEMKDACVYYHVAFHWVMGIWATSMSDGGVWGLEGVGIH